MIPQDAKLIHIKILAQVLLNYLSDFKAESKTKTFFTGAFKNFVNNFILKLSEVESKHFEKAINKEEEATSAIYDVTDEFYKTISSVPIWEMANIVTIINAYNKDQKSIEGICKKVLR